MDGYVESSDGSRQLKINLQCPMCRGAYQTTTGSCSTNDAANANAETSIIKASTIVAANILLRQAVATPLPGTVLDSECSATALTARNKFLEETNLKELQDAVKTMRLYNASLPDNKKRQPVPELDYDAWRPYLQNGKHSPKSASSIAVEERDLVLPRDPTLFVGLEDILTLDEQEFITSMLVSGKKELLVQAAQLLNGVLQVSAGPRSAQTIAQLSLGATGRTGNNYTNSQRRPPKMSMAQIEHQHKVRKRFPIPPHMPRCVTLPIFDPSSSSNSDNNLKFISKPDATHPPLTLAAVRGPAGKVGLRQGDVVTHVDGEPVQTMTEFVRAVQQQQQSSNSSTEETTMEITVNATPQIAQELRKRACDMKRQKIRFY
jgi:hypothetical protein